MIKYDYCPICKSKDIKIIKEEIYQYPKSKGIGWEEIINTRLRKLFDVILKSREEIIFNVLRCSKCNFIFRMPRLNKEEVNSKYNLDNKGLPYFWPIGRAHV